MNQKIKSVHPAYSIRHCMVVHAHYPFGETRVEREARFLEDHGFEVDVICLGAKSESKHDLINGINIYRLPVMRHLGIGLGAQLLEYLTFFTLASLKLIALHNKRHYNIVQVHNLPDWLVFVSLLPKLTGARVILDLHDLMPEFYAARFNRSLDSWPVRLLRWQEQLSCWYADHVITVTDGWRETLIERGVPASKISVVMNLADNRIFFCSGQEEVPSNRNGRLKLLYHGNVTHRYGIDLAIRAVGLALEHTPGIQLHIHGWGDAFQSSIDLTRELGLEEQVSFSTQSLLTSELPDMIREADLCLVPYRQDVFTDGILPTKLLEYAALEKPVIVSHTPTIARYFDETMVKFFKPGDVHDLANCIQLFDSRPELLEQLAHGISKFNQQYSWSDLGVKYIRTISQLAEIPLTE
jgi:glycosyltransferase involved in cell wall biosynthesis